MQSIGKSCRAEVYPAQCGYLQLSAGKGKINGYFEWVKRRDRAGGEGHGKIRTMHAC